MSDIRQAHKALIARIVEGEGETSREQRRAAFDNVKVLNPLRTLVSKVATHAYLVDDSDMAAALRAGLSEDQIFEIVVCAAVGQAARQYDAALAALAEATK